MFVVDSLSATIGERILCDYALRLIEAGNTAEEIVEKLEEKKKKVQIIAVVDTLKYLRKGGRISSVVAFAGEIFSIKPVISVINGEVKLVAKQLEERKATIF